MIIQRKRFKTGASTASRVAGLLAEDEHTMSTSFQDNFWLGKLSYFSAMFQSTNRLNLSLQG